MVLITFCSILLRMVKVSEKFYKNTNTFYVQYPLFDNRAVYGILWKNTE
jgi:hypothetical protein